MRPVRFFVIALLIVVCDQVSKWAVLRQMTWYEERPIVPHVLWLTLVRNTGGAFSLFPAWNAAFLVVAGVATVALLFAYFRYHRGDLVVSGALALALGGAIGNLIDRMRYGFVVDFFNLGVWPVFNVADAAITGGILLLAWHILWGVFHPRPRPESSNPAAADAVASREQPSS